MAQQYFNFGDTGETAKDVIDSNFLELYSLVDNKLIVQGRETTYINLTTNQPPAMHTGEYWIVDTATGTYLLGTRKSAGLYKSNGTTWVYTGINTTYHLEDTNWVLADGGDSTKQMQFQLDQITAGNNRIITVADYNQDLANPLFQTILLDTSYNLTGSEVVGTSYWDSDNHTITTVLEWGVKLQNGFELLKIGTDAGNDYPQGFAVSAMGTNGNRTLLVPTDTGLDSTNVCKYIGLITSDIDSGNRVVVREGAINGLDTTGGLSFGNLETWVEDDELWIDPLHPGYLTNVEPDAPNNIVSVGTITISHTTEGQVELLRNVHPKLVNLSDVNGTPLTTSGQILVWDQTNKYFDFNYNILNRTSTFNLAGLSVGTVDNNTTIESDGTIIFNGDATVWEDLNFAVVRSGGPVATRPDDVTINNVYYKEFTSANNQTCGDAAEIPHNAKLSTNLNPHAHIFLKSGESVGTTGVTFTLYWELRQLSGTTNGSVTMSATSAELSANANKVNIYNGGFTGPTELGAQLSLRLDRTAGNAGDVIVETYGIHYEIDSVGSREITTK